MRTTAATPTRSAAGAEWLPPLWAYVAAVAATAAIAYGPDIGRGFIKDDFGWILGSRIRSIQDVHGVFFPQTGFYRPLVSLSFSANEYLSGLNPFPYGATNLLLALAAATGVGWVARLWKLPAGACVFAAAIWLLNLHGINMAVLWISGRTALLLTLFSVLAAAAAARGRPVATTAAAFCAMISKEEAVLLPAPLLFIAFAATRDRARRMATAVGLAAAEAAYLVLRAGTGAIMPSTAPPFYRLTFAWSNVTANAAEYADRACTFTVAAVAILWILSRAVPARSTLDRRPLLAGSLWLLAGFGITLFVPVRSSLYACFPSVGVAWMGAAVATAIWRAAPPRRRQIAAIVALVVPFLLIPVYRARNNRWVELAVLSRSVMPALEQAARTAQEGNVLVIDERSTRVNLASAFDGNIGDAFALLSGQRGSVWLVPPPPATSSSETVPVPSWVRPAWVLKDGRLVPQPPEAWFGRPAVVFH